MVHKTLAPIEDDTEDAPLRLQRTDGSLVPTPEEDRIGRERAEAEVARLQAELERRQAQ